MTATLEAVLTYAREEAARAGHKFVRSEHLLLGLLRLGENSTAHLLPVSYAQVAAQVETLPCPVCSAAQTLALTPRAQQSVDTAVANARTEAGLLNQLLFTLIRESLLVRQLLHGAGVPAEMLRQMISSA